MLGYREDSGVWTLRSISVLNKQEKQLSVLVIYSKPLKVIMKSDIKIMVLGLTACSSHANLYWSIDELYPTAVKYDLK